MKTQNLFFLIVILSSNLSFGQGKWTNYTKKDGLASNWVLTILEDKQDNIWFGTDKGLNKFDGLNFETFTTKDGLPNKVIRSILEDKDGIIWFRTDKGLCRYDRESFTSLESEMTHEYVSRTIGVVNGEIWIGGFIKEQSGFFLIDYDGQSWNPLTKLGGVNLPPVNFFYSEGKDNVWIFSIALKGDFISHFDGTNLISYGEKDGLPSHAAGRFIKNYFKDSKGNLWLGAHFDKVNGGLMKFDGAAWTTYTNKDGLLGKGVITHIIEDDDENIWVVTNKAVNVFNGSVWKNFTDEDKLPSNIIEKIIKDTKGRIWIGTTEGLVLFDKGNWSQFNRKNGLQHNHVRDIQEDSKGNIWVGAASDTKKGGISVYIDNKWIAFNSKNLPDFYTQDIFEDSKGNIWILTIGNGVFKYEY